MLFACNTPGKVSPLSVRNVQHISTKLNQRQHILPTYGTDIPASNACKSDMAVGYFWLPIGLGALVFVLALDIMGIFSRKNHFEVEGRVS